MNRLYVMNPETEQIGFIELKGKWRCGIPKRDNTPKNFSDKVSDYKITKWNSARTAKRFMIRKGFTKADVGGGEVDVPNDE